MASTYDASDLKFGFDGDYIIDSTGDLADTFSDQIQSLIQEITTIANSDTLDWLDWPDRAAALNDFVGEPNNKDTANRLVERLRSSLISNNIVRADDLSIRAIPTGRHEIILVVSVAAAATSNNSLNPGQGATVILAYDYREQGVFIVDQNQFYNATGVIK